MRIKYNLEKIKLDLHELKSLNKRVEIQLKLEQRYNKRLEFLRSEEQTISVLNEISKIESVKAKIPIRENIKKMTKLEQKYMGIINLLNETDKAIIIDAFINGTPYWKIGNNLGYTESGVQKRVNKALIFIAENL